MVSALHVVTDGLDPEKHRVRLVGPNTNTGGNDNATDSSQCDE